MSELSTAIAPPTWNVLRDQWVEVLYLNAKFDVISPMDCLSAAGEINRIVAANPLDLYAAHRFLLVLLYWKASGSGGVGKTREQLLGGTVPEQILQTLDVERTSFELFDAKYPFLQDPTVFDQSVPEVKSAGSLFSEFSVGTNVAHFHHGDDEAMRLCFRCATVGLIRTVPWTQAGGAGLTPSIHGAPPITVLALGTTLAETLGLNLIDLPGNLGVPVWSGHFTPQDKGKEISALEAMTWNPRRIHLTDPKTTGTCWRCGCKNTLVVGPIVYMKNEKTAKRSDKKPFEWRDPAVFYGTDPKNPLSTVKSGNEALAADGGDLRRLTKKDAVHAPMVVEKLVGHKHWHLTVPCTNPANNKSFDHRSLELRDDVMLSIEAGLPVPLRSQQKGVDGWRAPYKGTSAGSRSFVSAALQLLHPQDWAVLANAAYLDMHASPAAFDILTGLLWPLRGKVSRLPARSAAWLTLKLMASMPSENRNQRHGSPFDPLADLPMRQTDFLRNGHTVQSVYPLSFPRGYQLERSLREALAWNFKRRAPGSVNWATLCSALDTLID